MILSNYVEGKKQGVMNTVAALREGEEDVAVTLRVHQSDLFCLFILLYILLCMILEIRTRVIIDLQ